MNLFEPTTRRPASITRRSFLRVLAGASAALGFSASTAFAQSAQPSLVILHTNDMHSRIDPFPMDGSRFQGLGGVSRRAALIRQIRAQHRHVLLVDSGDIFQGTPYFNFFKGAVELKAMSAMGYDAATLGNHDFDNGVEGLVDVIEHARFPLVCANYDASRSALREHLRPWVIRKVGPIRVGIFGLGINFDRLVPEHLHRGVKHIDPIGTAREVIQELKRRRCDLILCLSHIGYQYADQRISDIQLANQLPGLDLLLGGHTHTFMDQPDHFEHAHDRPTLVHQVGFAGIRLGRIDVTFDSARRPTRYATVSLPVGART